MSTHSDSNIITADVHFSLLVFLHKPLSHAKVRCTFCETVVVIEVLSKFVQPV